MTGGWRRHVALHSRAAHRRVVLEQNKQKAPGRRGRRRDHRRQCRCGDDDVDAWRAAAGTLGFYATIPS